MKTNYFKIGVWITVLLFACNHSETDDAVKTEVRTFFNDKKHVNELLDRCINKGDTVAYDEIEKFHIMDGSQEKILYLSMIMANKYNYSTAYYNVYYELLSQTGGYLDQLDKRSKNLALYYLALSKEKGYVLAGNEISRIEEYTPFPHSNFFLSELAKIDSMQGK